MEISVDDDTVQEFVRWIVRLNRKRSLVAAGALAISASLVLAGCAESNRTQSGSGDGGTSDTFVFAGSDEPQTLDPFFASDGESFRVSRQIFEGLVGTAPGTPDPAPLLATEWTNTPDGLSYTFKLRTGVKFQDGTDFNAEAVCANFERWYNMPVSAQTLDTSYYYLSLFRGFKTGPDAKEAVYQSCTADAPDSATIKLQKPFAGFVAALSLPAFSMQSPTAQEQYQDDAAANVKQTEYSTAHPVGTGPFKLESWEKGKQITLARYDDYWGEKAKMAKVAIVAIGEPRARATALENGEIDGFDLAGPGDLQGLKDAGMQLINRPAFNILYLGINQAQKPLDNIKVRQAIAHALNKDEIIKASMPEGTTPAIEFIPDSVAGYTDSVTKYDYDPEKAKQLLAEAGATNLTLEFNYPTDVSRPYMPQPEDTFNAIRAQLEAVGIKIKPVSTPWTDYTDKIQGTKQHGIHLLGWTGDYNDTDNFLGVFFGAQSDEWGFSNPPLFNALKAARAIPTVDAQTPAYEKINQQVMDFLPGIPIAHPVPTLAFDPAVTGYTASPVQDEVWNQVSISE